jgi:hypothetical protein
MKYWLPRTTHHFALVLITAITAPWAAARASIVYTIDQTGTTPIVSSEPSPLSDTVSGSITTDGTIGILHPSNILSWDLGITDNFNASYDVVLTPSNSTLVEDLGSGLTASATALSFNFSDVGAEFLIQGTTHGAFSGYQYFCFSATGGACAAGETIVPDYYAVDGVEVTGLSGSLPLNPPPPPTGVPEPAAPGPARSARHSGVHEAPHSLTRSKLIAEIADTHLHPRLPTDSGVSDVSTVRH